MSDQTIFQNQPATPPTPNGDGQQQGGGNPPNASSDPINTMLSEIKNERGEAKYKSVQDALTALKHSQDYIPQLSQKLQSTEAELAAARTAADKVAELERTLQALTQQSSQSAQAQPAPAGVSKEEIAALVTSTLQARQQSQVAGENLKTVTSAALAEFGEKAEEEFYKRATELNMSREQINALAMSNPQVVLKALGIGAKAKPQSAPFSNGSIRTEGLQPQQGSLIGRNSTPTLIGATTAELQTEVQNANRMVDELHSKGLTVKDLTDPKVFFKQFK